MDAHIITAAPSWLPAIIAAGTVAAIGVLIWSAMPRRTRRERDIERQIATLRRHADHAVQHRPRVRDGGYQPVGTTGPAKPPPRNPDKPCGGGMCRHRANCADHHCPGRFAASLAGTTPPKAAPQPARRGGTVSYQFSTTKGPHQP